MLSLRRPVITTVIFIHYLLKTIVKVNNNNIRKISVTPIKIASKNNLLNSLGK